MPCRLTPDPALVLENDRLYEATGGVVLLGRVTVRRPLVALYVAGGPGVLLYASAFTGIIAADGGGAWAGAAGIALPFP